MKDKSFKLLSLFLSIFFFIFYITIVNVIFNRDFLSFPYIIPTIYFSISTFTFPFVSLEAEEKSKEISPTLSRFMGKYSLIITYLIAPIWVSIKILKSKEE